MGLEGKKKEAGKGREAGETLKNQLLCGVLLSKAPW